MKFTSSDRAQRFVSLGMATMSLEGRLLFALDNQILQLEHISEEVEFRRNRGERVYWNGARNYPGAAFPPGCNVEFPKTGTLAAARRYCRA
jgi:hypothetical protein